MRSSVLVGSLTLLIATAACQRGGPPGGMACTVQHPAKTSPCTPLSGSPEQGTWGVVLKEGVFKTCAPSGDPQATCTEKAKATHTIEVYRNPQCRGAPQKIAVDENRCD